MRIVAHWLPGLIGVHAIAVHSDLILMRPSRAPGGDSEDPPLWAHEREHCEQQAEMWGGAALWWIAYLLNPWFRLRCEVAAYNVQICATPEDKQTAKLVDVMDMLADWWPYMLPLGWTRARRLEAALKRLS